MALLRSIIATFTILVVGALGAPAEPPALQPSNIKPDVAALLKKLTRTYSAMPSYYADIEMKTARSSGGARDTVNSKFLLALQRPTNFCYRELSDEDGAAAVCDGSVFTNFKPDRNQYIQTPAPKSYSGINIVDDVSFEPLATYLIALMLQGDAIADKDVHQAMCKAYINKSYTENGITYQVLHVPFGPQEEPFDLFINPDGQIVKAVMRAKISEIDVEVVENIKNIRVGAKIDAAVFVYRPPVKAKKVDRFTAPQRLFDARQNIPSPVLHLAGYAPPTSAGPSPQVLELIQQAAAAYGKFNSYRHTATFRAQGNSGGKHVDQSAKFLLAVDRPSRFCFKMLGKQTVAAVCDGKVFTDFRAGEYSQLPAPANLKNLSLDFDDFDPVAGSCLVAHLLLDNVMKDPRIAGILFKASVHRGINVDSKTYDALDFPMVGLTFVMYFDPTTHLLVRTASKVPDQDLILTESFDEIETDKPLPASLFNFNPPSSAKRVNRAPR